MKHFVIFTLIAASALGQQATRLNARELFYTSPPPAADANKKKEDKNKADSTHRVDLPAPLGLRYAVLKRDSAGVYREVDPDATFRSGDSIRIQVEANSPGYLYVVTQGASGQWCVLFPRPGVANAAHRIAARVKIQLPNEEGAWRFDERPGTEKLFLLLARQPAADLDKLVAANGSDGCAQSAILTTAVTRIRQQMSSRDLVYEKVDETTNDASAVKNETAAYVVTTNPAADARVVRDFSLQHR